MGEKWKSRKHRKDVVFLLGFMIYEARFHTKKPLSLEPIGRYNSKFGSE